MFYNDSNPKLRAYQNMCEGHSPASFYVFLIYGFLSIHVDRTAVLYDNCLRVLLKWLTMDRLYYKLLKTAVFLTFSSLTPCFVLLYMRFCMKDVKILCFRKQS